MNLAERAEKKFWGLGYCDLVSPIKNLAIPNAEFGLQIAECLMCFRLGHRDQEKEEGGYRCTRKPWQRDTEIGG